MTKSEIKLLVREVAKKTDSMESVFTKVDNLFRIQRDIRPILHNIKESKRQIFIMPVEIHSSFNPKSAKVELETVFEMIRTGSFQSDQESLERLISENRLMPDVFFAYRKRYTPCGIFYHKKGRLDIRMLNQLLIFESKKMALNEKDILLLKGDLHTFSFYRQIYPDRYYLLVRTIKLHSRNYFEYQDKIEKYYAKLLGSKKFTSMNLNAAVPFSYDAALYHNALSKVFSNEAN
jgi:hypothetical protein